MSVTSMNAPIGATVLERIDREVDSLRAQCGPLGPYVDAMRLGDEGYVTIEAWNAFWRDRPDWEQAAWMLADNGQYSAADVESMTPAQALERYQSPDFEPEYAYFTDTGEDGVL